MGGIGQRRKAMLLPIAFFIQDNKARNNFARKIPQNSPL
jgi:hypothetical protein